MEWHFVIMAILGILGAALAAGGVVAYRASARVSVRAFGAAAIAAGLVMWAIILSTTPLSVTRGDAADQYEVTVRFSTSATQDDIEKAGAFLETYDEDVEFLMTRCYPPMGTAEVTTDVPDTIVAELEAKSYVDHVSYRPGGPGTSVEPQPPARCE